MTEWSSLGNLEGAKYETIPYQQQPCYATGSNFKLRQLPTFDIWRRLLVLANDFSNY
jgi:hypothetical protein